MSARMVVLALAAIAVAPALAVAQDSPAGQMTWRFTGKVPAEMTAQAPMPIDRLPQMIMMFASDGKQFGMEMSMQGTDSAPPFNMIAETRVKVLWRDGGDSIHFAVGVPASLRAMAANLLAPDAAASPPPGYRLAIKAPNIDSMLNAQKDKAKVEMKSEGREPKVTALGTSSVVAGITCENWRVVEPVDSSASKPDTLELCMIDSNSRQLPIGAWMARRFKLDEAMKDAEVTKYFGGRSLYPIRMKSSDNSFSMELVSASATAPAAAFFTVPSDYRTVDPKGLPIPGVGGS